VEKIIQWWQKIKR